MQKVLLSRVLIFIVSVLFFGCDGSTDVENQPPKEVFNELTVTVVDGYLEDATVWLDINADGMLDTEEPSAVSDEKGIARLSVPSNIDTQRFFLMAHADPEKTIDKDTGERVVHPFMLASPPGHNILSPLTTLMVIHMKQIPTDLLFSENPVDISLKAMLWASEIFGIPTETVMNDFIASEKHVTHYAASMVTMSGLLPRDSITWQKLTDKNSSQTSFEDKAYQVGQAVIQQVGQVDTSNISNFSQIPLIYTVVGDNDQCPEGFVAEATVCVIDTDGDQRSNFIDNDDDGDGVVDTEDMFPLDSTESVDTDLDGIGNNTDQDDDDDGYNDDQDQLPLDPSDFQDTDGDGIGNKADTDDDNDGVPDSDDVFPLDPDESVDTDNDGTGNYRDTDDDDDGVPDTEDAFPLDPQESVDTDQDGMGNNRDTDDDEDGVPDVEDAFPLDTSESMDTDGDKVGDNTDVFPMDPTEWQDSDGDRVGDNADAFPGDIAASVDRNNNGKPDIWNSDCFRDCQQASNLELDWDGIGPATIQGRSDGVGVDLVILGDGFTKEDKQVFKNTVNDVFEHFYNEATIKTHIQGWNIHVIGTESNESGIRSSPTANPVDTFFDSYFGCYNIARLYCVNVSRVQRETNEHFPQWDILLLAGNTKQYGGAGYSKLGTFSLANSAIEIAVHELGHSFAGLADEYTYGRTSPPGTEPSQPNITVNNDPASLKWKYWVSHQSTHPIPNESHRVGHYEGGQYVKEGVWRPTKNSIMRSLGNAFHAVNAEAWALKVYKHGEPVLSFSPEETSQQSPKAHPLEQPVVFKIDTVYDLAKLKVLWFVNDEKVDNDGSLTFSPNLSSSGVYKVEVRVSDDSGLILFDPKNYSRRTLTWFMEATK
ncbi:M64 family metallopeptidase [Veronia pacifica]|uniref:Peptidase M64 N-terminal domain-containing protein n=1 Tax=Veronia pacifica TaxID=1080227 RepID=A0A1C3ESL6_9GAMM|nr:M64 family metallopeptidase [Veronia pacifica]ODA36196.1 hypothetical protein A8L45_00910 [Veronia pacifica]